MTRPDFPDAAEIGRRRTYQRTPDPRPPLRCVANVGDAVVFEATVSDVSQGGIRLEIEFAAEELEPGMVLAGCHLECSGREPVAIVLEVRHTATAMSPHGPRVVRAGCRFVNLSPAANALIAAYVDPKPHPN